MFAPLESDESKCLDSAKDTSERETHVWPKMGPEEPTTAERSWHGRSAVSSSKLVQELWKEEVSTTDTSEQ